MKKKDFEYDYIKHAKKFARDEFGMEPTRVVQSKKKYNRKKQKKINLEEDE